MILFYKTTVIDKTLIKRNKKLSYSKDLHLSQLHIIQNLIYSKHLPYLFHLEYKAMNKIQKNTI